MMSASSPLRKRIAGNSPIGLFWMSLGSLPVLELAAQAGPDAIVLDAQHGLWDRVAIENAIGLGSKTVPMLVRVAQNLPSLVGQALDAGAEGVIVPLIESEVEAAAAVSAARFPPEGSRSGGGVRPLARDFRAYYTDATQRTIVGVMIETTRGVEQARAIASTSGVDFVLIGTGDLAVSINGLPRVDTRHIEACASVLKACNAAGIPCGIYTNNAENAAARQREGYPIVVVANDIDIVSTGFSHAMNRFGVRDHRTQVQGDADQGSSGARS